MRIFLTSLLLITAMTAVAELRICKKCGYEAASGISSCGHCGASLPTEKVDNIPPTPPDPDPIVPTLKTRGYLPAKHVEREIAKGEKVLKDKKYALSVFFFRNAAALNALSPPKSAKKRGENIDKYISYAQKMTRRVLKTCSSCQGSGKASVYMRALSTDSSDGEDSSRKKVTSSYKKCPRCNGRGSTYRNLKVALLQGKYGRASTQYKKLQKSQRLSQLGNAWIDSEFAQQLTLEEEVELRRAAALPCEDCVGSGYDDCKKCNGQGIIDCKVEGCLDGSVESSTASGLQGGVSGVTRLEDCSTCYGKSYIVCEDCNGSGGKTCRDCKGSGERDLCSKCDGEGLATCRKCKGTGTYKDEPCKYCKEKGLVRCTSCNGNGRKD